MFFLSEETRQFCFPLDHRPLDWTAAARYFGAPRPGGRLHAGCDLLAPVGTIIYSIADGVLVSHGSYQFTGPRQGLLVTHAVEIRYGSLLVRYGEILPGSYIGGSQPKKGQAIARVGRVGNHPMLHFELYTNGLSRSPLTVAGPKGGKYRRRSDITNPDPYLREWVKNVPVVKR